MRLEFNLEKDQDIALAGLELELNLKPEQVKTRELFREETAEEAKILTQAKPGDTVEPGINRGCTKPHPKGFTQLQQHKQTKNRADSKLEFTP